MSKTPIELTILMPCLNEARTLVACIRAAFSFLARTGHSGEVLIADNGSTDGSQELARSLGARVVSVSTPGYGAALMGGIEAAAGRFVIMGDSDDSYDFANLDRFVEKLRQGYDLVMGNRFAGGIEPGAMPRLHRYLGNPVLSGLGKLFFRVDCNDFHCGLRGFRRDSILSLDLRTTGMEFASEMVVKAALLKLRIAEVPTTLSKDGRGRPSHLRSWRDGWRHLRFLLMYSPRWLFLFPGIFLFVFGLIAVALPLPGRFLIGDVAFDVHTMLIGAASMLVGSQAVIFFYLAAQYGANERLVPPGRGFASLRRWFNLELAVAIGAILAFCGVLGILFMTLSWAFAGFSALNRDIGLRVLIPSVTLVGLGIQLVLGGFLSSILDLKTRTG